MLEQEIKLTAENESVLTAVLSSSFIHNLQKNTEADLTAQPVRYIAQYYDNKSLDLERSLSSLRARREGSLMRAAFKSKGRIVDGLSCREEFEIEIVDWLNTASDLPEGELKQKVAGLIDLADPLICRVQIETQRTTVMLEIEGSRVELVADHAKISGVNGTHILYEIELELKSGPIKPMIEVGQRLKTLFALKPSKVTKHQIGLTLCQ